jgi:DNA-directed RNA polymerase subunit beta
MTKVFSPNEWFRRSFGKNDGVMDPPGLMKLQISSYEEFLQKDVPLQDEKRKVFNSF